MDLLYLVSLQATKDRQAHYAPATYCVVVVGINPIRCNFWETEKSVCGGGGLQIQISLKFLFLYLGKVKKFHITKYIHFTAIYKSA